MLFLDELPEFKRQTLDMLRQPMEEGQIVITRKSGSYVYPCNFMLVAAMKKVFSIVIQINDKDVCK